MRSIWGVVAILLLVMSLGEPALAATVFNCTANSGVPPLLRAEGTTELGGDVVIICTGGDPAEIRFVNIDAFFNVNATSRITGPGAGETEALLLIDEAQPGVVNTSNGVQYTGQVKGTPSVSPGPAGGTGAPGSGNVYQAIHSAADNRLTWNGIPIRPPGGTAQRTIRITNVRVNASQTSSSGQSQSGITMFLSISPQNSLPLSNPQQVIGTVLTSLDFTVLGAVLTGRDLKSSIDLKFTERFATAFRKRIENNPGGPLSASPQSLPGASYNTESGLTPEFGSMDLKGIGVADVGTRLLAHFYNLPPNAALSAPDSVPYQYPVGPAGQSAGGLEIRRVMQWGTSYSGGFLAPRGGGYHPVDIRDNEAVLLYEVVAAESPYEGVNGASAIDDFTVSVRIAGGDFSSSTATVSGQYAPLSTDPGPNSFSAIPRFPDPGTDAPTFPVVAPPSVGSVNFRYGPADPKPITQAVTIDSQGRALTSSLTAVTLDKGNWLSFQAPSSTHTAVMVIVVDPTGLTPNTYKGSINYSLDTPQHEKKSVTVALTVVGPSQLLLDTSPLTFNYTVGNAPPAPIVVYLTASNKAVQFTVAAAATGGGNWLTVAATSSSTPANLSVAANPAGLGAGAYSGTVTIASETAANSPQTIPVTLVVSGAGPSVTAAGIVNAASFLHGPVAPGELITIFGMGIGPAQLTHLQLDSNGNVSTSLADTRILFDDVPAPLIYVSTTQSAAVVPYDVDTHTSTQMIVEYQGVKSAPVSLEVATTAPGIFSTTFTGTGQGAILNQDFSANGAGNPAAAGSTVMIYATGEGQTVPPGENGKIANVSSLPVPKAAAVTVMIGGKPADVKYAGGAPGSVAGVLQVNAKVPEGLGGGNVPVVLTIDGRPSQSGLTLAVQ